MTLPNEQVARYKPGENIALYADPAAIEAGRFCKITGRNAGNAYIGGHCGAGQRANGVSERKVPAVPTAGARAPERHSTNLNRIGAIAFVEAGAAVAVNALVVSDATGRAVTAATTGHFIQGQALTAATAAGQYIEVDTSIRGTV